MQNKKNEEIISNKMYRHFKNAQLYEVIGIAHHSETQEELVVYKALYQTEKHPYGSLWVRPKKMFFETVLHNGKNVPRFQPVEPAE